MASPILQTSCLALQASVSLSPRSRSPLTHSAPAPRRFSLWLRLLSILSARDAPSWSSWKPSCHSGLSYHVTPPSHQAKVTLSYILLDLTSPLPMSAGTWYFLFFHYCLVVVQSLSHVHLFVTPWTAPCPTSLSFTISWNLLQLMTTESVMLSHHLILCCPLLLLPSVFPSIITIYPPLIRMQIPQDLTCLFHGCRSRKTSWWGAQNSRPGPVTFGMCLPGQWWKPSRLQFPYP